MCFVPDVFVPEVLVPDVFVPDACIPDVFVPDGFVPDVFALFRGLRVRDELAAPHALLLVRPWWSRGVPPSICSSSTRRSITSLRREMPSVPGRFELGGELLQRRGM